MSTAARKVKINLSLDAALLGAVDNLAAREGVTRSAVIERWLQQVPARLKTAAPPSGNGKRIRPQRVLTAREQSEDDAWASVLARAARVR